LHFFGGGFIEIGDVFGFGAYCGSIFSAGICPRATGETHTVPVFNVAAKNHGVCEPDNINFVKYYRGGKPIGCFTAYTLVGRLA
jgi:hypothetical protein